jgi:hypothetical protein
MRKALQPSEDTTARRPRGARPASEEGNVNHSLTACRGTVTTYLRSGRIGPHSHTATVSPILGATDGGLETPPRTRRREELWPSVPHLPAGLHLFGRRPGWCGVARCLLSLGRATAVARRALRENRAGSGGKRNGPGSQQRAPALARARIGRSRSCSRVIHVVAEVDRQCPTQRSGRSPLHPIWRRSGTGV